MAIRLKTFPKLLLAAVVFGGLFGVYALLDSKGVIPKAVSMKSLVPQKAELPTQTAQNTTPSSDFKAAAMPSDQPAQLSTPQIRIKHWAWNSQLGAFLATGGKETTKGSLMEKYGVNLRWERQDDVPQMQNDLITFADALRNGNPHPTVGAHFVSIMWDGAPAFVTGVNEQLKRLGSDYTVEYVGSCGFSRGEDKFMGLPEWKANPQSGRGSLITGVIGDGDWNIALKWAADNGIPNNPDETTYDPDALNWVSVTSYLDAADKYITGYCEDRPVVRKGVKTTETKHVCVNGVVTWTPGDVNIARKKGGLVSIVSTREYFWQMPNALIGVKKWNSDNRQLVESMLAAIFEGGDNVKANPAALRHATRISADVYREEDAAYWEKYYRVQTERDARGLTVELGGSSVNNLADNQLLFGLAPGSVNVARAVYTTFGDILKQQYPTRFPNYWPVDEVINPSFVQNLGGRMKSTTAPETATFSSSSRIEDVVSKRSWTINFRTGSADFTPDTLATMQRLQNDLVIAGTLAIEVHGHTDNVGDDEMNMGLSERRAFAVKSWLETQSSVNFPQGRIRVRAFGETQPVSSNDSEVGRAANRRVEIVLGTTN